MAAGRRQVLPRVPVAPASTPDKLNAVVVQCYKCGGPNHFAKDCRQPGSKSRRALPEIRCYQGQQQGHVASRCPGKLGKVREAGTTLYPHKLEEVLPVMKVKVNGLDRIALVDFGCSSSAVSGMLCRPEVWKSTAILTASRKCLLSHGVGSIAFNSDQQKIP